MPAAQDLLKTSNNFNISAMHWLDDAGNRVEKIILQTPYFHITDVSPTLLGIKLPGST